MAVRPWTHVAWMGMLALASPASEAALLPEVTPAGQVAAPYSHRFTAGDKLVSTPTFTLSSGLGEGLEASLRLALDSDIQRKAPEWEPRLTYQLGPTKTPWRLAVATAYNSAAVSGDLALIGSYELGSVTLRGSSCAFSSGFGVGGPTGAMGLGLGWRLTEWLTATVDYGGVVLAQDLEAIANQLPPLGLTQAWRLGLLVGEHLELYVTNSHTHTLQGLHRGSDQVQVGFEYQLPIWRLASPSPAADVSLPDFKHMPDPFAVSMGSPSPAPVPIEEVVPPIRIAPAIAPSIVPLVREQVAEVLEVRMGARGYAPAEILVKRGTVVRWINHDRISHTATSKGLWDSLWKKPGKAFERRFEKTGVYPYQCKRHPHERGVVRVI